jgi:hypothetical protein
MTIGRKTLGRITLSIMTVSRISFKAPRH